MFLFDKSKDPDKFVLMPGQMNETKEKLEAGVYNLNLIPQGMSEPLISFEKTTKYEGGMIIKGGVFDEAHASLDKFAEPEMYEARNDMGMMHKVGVIFDGKPGTGKTFLAGQVCERFAREHNAIGIISTQHKLPYPEIIDSIREFDKDRLIVLVMDEFEKSNARHYTSMLSFLDGSDSRDNIIVIATINDISDMPSYLKDRPGRFENILKFRSDDKLILKSIVTQCIPEKYKKDFNVDTLVTQFTTKSNAERFGLKNERDDFTVDRLRVVIRDLIAGKIKEHNSKETGTVDLKAQIKLATQSVKSVDTTPTDTYDDLTFEALNEFVDGLPGSN